MRNLSLEQFYKKIKKKIVMLGGYLDDKSIVPIVRACRLKPIKVFSESFDFATSLEEAWVDEFNNVVEIKKKKIKVRWNASDVSKTTTDIYRNETIDFIIAHSKLALIGLYPGTENFILLLLGTDNYLRCYNYVNQHLDICSPLRVGVKMLKYYLNSKTGKYFKKLTVKSDIKELSDIEWFITPLPTTKLFLPNIVAYSKLRSILYNE
jgi:hypothetical protein